MQKSTLLILLGAMVSSLTFAQSEETRSLSSFSEITAQEAISVYIKNGSTEEARVVTDNIDIDKVLTEVSGGRLKIHLDGNNWRNVDVKVYVTYKSLEALGASSAASIEAEGEVVADGDFDVDVSSAGSVRASIKAEELTLDATSAGDIELDVNVDEIEADVSSSGDIEIEGTARYQDIDVSSSGDYDAYDLECEEADVSASSGGSVKVKVTKKIDASASSGGSVRYQGSPQYVDVSSSSGGSVRKS